MTFGILVKKINNNKNEKIIKIVVMNLIALLFSNAKGFSICNGSNYMLRSSHESHFLKCQKTSFPTTYSPKNIVTKKYTALIFTSLINLHQVPHRWKECSSSIFCTNIPFLRCQTNQPTSDQNPFYFSSDTRQHISAVIALPMENRNNRKLVEIKSYDYQT